MKKTHIHSLRRIASMSIQMVNALLIHKKGEESRYLKYDSEKEMANMAKGFSPLSGRVQANSFPRRLGGCDWKWVRSCRLKPAFRPPWNAGFSRQPRSARAHLITPAGGWHYTFALTSAKAYGGPCPSLPEPVRRP